jgi:hypothetical protein
MQKPLIVSFYTKDHLYPQYAEKLKKDCERLGLDYHIELKPSTKQYLKNTCIKPSFIRECLEFGRPILWLDVDSTLYSEPEFFYDDSYDFQGVKIKDVHRTSRIWHVHCLWFNPNDKTKQFVDEWVKLAETSNTDEVAFNNLWKSKDVDMKWREAPQEDYSVWVGEQDPEPEVKTVLLVRYSNSPSKRETNHIAEKEEIAERAALTSLNKK